MKSAAKLSRITLGSWSLIGDANWGDQPEADSVAAIEAALAAGITSFDTAPSYGEGESERILGKVLSSRREEVFIATKVNGRLTAERIRSLCEASLARLNTDYVDLYYLHWPDRQTPLGEAAEMLLKLQEEGKIRAMGVCNFGPRDIVRAAALMPVAANQIPYSLLWRGAEFELLPLCRKMGIPVLAYSPLQQGLLTGKFRQAGDVPEGRARTKHFSTQGRPLVRHGLPGHEAETFTAINAIRELCEREDVPMDAAALGYVLSQTGVVSALAGARNAEQARRNATATQLIPDPGLLSRLREATEELKQRIGPDIDPWATPSRIE